MGMDIGKKAPLVSVVMPIYNVEKYLSKAIESVLSQTLKDIELILVNDGSTDGSLDIINEYAKKDTRIVVVNKKNGGYASAVNAGLDIAKGDYVAEIDSDDYIVPNMYNSLYSIAVEQDVDVVISNYSEFVGSYDTFQETPKKQIPTEYYNTVLYPEQLIADCKTELFGLIAIWTSLYRRQFLNENNIRINENVFCYNDTGFWYKTRTLAKSIYFVDEQFYYYRNDVDGQTIKKLNERFHIYLQEYFDIKNDFIKRGMWSNVCSLWYRHFISSCFYFLMPRIQADSIQKLIEIIKPELKSLVKDAVLFNTIKKAIGQDAVEKIYSILKDEKKFINNYIDNQYIVSVIMPVFNGAKHLHKTIPSIINQDFKDFELILIDDCSTDNSLSIIKSYERDPRVKVVALPQNKGQSAARNIGLDIAKGKYVLFLDCDDIFELDLLGNLWWHMNAFKLDVCITGYSVYNCRKKEITYTCLHEMLPSDTFAGSELSPTQLSSIVGWNWDKMYRRDFLLQNSLRFPEDIRISEDALVAYPAVLLANKVYIVKKNLITYNEFGASSVSSRMDKYIEDNFKYYDKLYDFFKINNMLKTHRKHFYNLFVQHIVFALEELIKKDSTKEIVFNLLVGEYLERFGLSEETPDTFFPDEEALRRFQIVRRMMRYSVGQYEDFLEGCEKVPVEVDSYKFGYEFKHENIVVLKPTVQQYVSTLCVDDKERVGKDIKSKNLFALLLKIMFNSKLRTRVYEILKKNL